MLRRARTLTRTGRPAALGAAVALLLAGLLPAGAGAVSAAHAPSVASHPATSAAARPSTGVVNIVASLTQGAVAGTGIVLTSSGEVLTNNHVIRGGTRVRVTDPATGRTYAATAVGYSLSGDIALLKLAHASGLTTARIGDSSTVRVGDAVTAVGNAGGVGGSPTVTTGTVTGVHRTITVGDDQGGFQRLTDLVKTDASLEPGDSGGPLLDASGRVIGIDTAAETGFAFRAAGGSGGGYAIPIDRALAIVKLIEAGRATATVHVGPTSFLGISVSRPDGTGGAAAGALVAGVLPGSPADKAGLAAGDVITRLAGQAVTSPTGLVNVLLHASPGDPLRLVWADRSGATHGATVRPIAGPPQ